MYLLAEMAHGLPQVAIELLTSRPYSSWDSEAWTQQLPQPMYPDNLEVRRAR